MSLRPRVLRRKTVGDTNHDRTVQVCEGAGGVAHLQAVAHEKPAAKYQHDQRTAAILGRSFGPVDADLTLIPIAHGNCAGLFEAAGGEG